MALLSWRPKTILINDKTGLEITLDETLDTSRKIQHVYKIKWPTTST